MLEISEGYWLTVHDTVVAVRGCLGEYWFGEVVKTAARWDMVDMTAARWDMQGVDMSAARWDMQGVDMSGRGSNLVVRTGDLPIADAKPDMTTRRRWEVLCAP